VNGPVHAAASQQRLIGGIHNGVDLLPGNIAENEVNSTARCHHFHR
jgi:hypothetical protein